MEFVIRRFQTSGAKESCRSLRVRSSTDVLLRFSARTVSHAILMLFSYT